VCFELDSAPPIPVISGAAVSHDGLTLESSDGTELAAFAAHPDKPSDAGVVLLPDVRGLYRFYEELALRFAERGISAVAFDYFGRTAGASRRGEDFEYRPHVEQTTTPTSAGSSGLAAKAANVLPSAASSLRSSCETAAPRMTGIGGDESRSKHTRRV